jgi:hypothetical protein
VRNNVIFTTQAIAAYQMNLNANYYGKIIYAPGEIQGQTGWENFRNLILY